MKNPTCALLFRLLIGVVVGPASSAKDKGLDVLISADATPSPEGFRPKPDKPIHYLLFQSRETLGETVAGVKLPDSATVERALVTELEKQGFVRAVDGGPSPEIAIFAVVGDANFKDEIPPGNPWNDDRLRSYLQAVNIRQILFSLGGSNVFAEVPTVEETFKYGEEPFRGTELSDAVVNEARRLRNLDPARKRNAIKALVGAKKVDQAVADRALSSSEAEAIARAAFDDQFYVSLSAVEAKKQSDGGRRFLWRTTMLIDWREDFTKALPAMLAQAGPVFGTDLAVPGFVNTAKPREGKVDIGETKVVTGKDYPAESSAKK